MFTGQGSLIMRSIKFLSKLEHKTWIYIRYWFFSLFETKSIIFEVFGNTKSQFARVVLGFAFEELSYLSTLLFTIRLSNLSAVSIVYIERLSFGRGFWTYYVSVANFGSVASIFYLYLYYTSFLRIIPQQQ